MRQGESQKYISLVKNERDTLQGVFLNLQPELWNDDRTVLTIWLDPGRIKRDLQPNKRLGNPLKKGDSYKIVISPLWKSTEDLALKQEYSKRFFAAGRDSLSPDPNQWIVSAARSNTKDALTIDLREALDYYLLNESITILDESRNPLPGTFAIVKQEHELKFTPTSDWRKGRFILQIEARLEDLAGNNLNRPFDRDVTNGKAPGSKPLYERSFQVR